MKLLWLTLAILALGTQGKKHQKDAEFTNFLGAAPIEDGGHHSSGDVGFSGDVGAGVGYSGVALSESDVGLGDADGFDPRLADPPCVWTAWSGCDAACNGGAAYRKRKITKECPYGPSDQVKTCNSQPCPQDCQVGQWAEWGCGPGCTGCSAPCGGGTRTRTRQILSPAMFGGVCDAESVSETETCNSQQCPLDCLATSAWSQWSLCEDENGQNKPCGGGRRVRSRSTSFVEVVRPGNSQQEAECPDTQESEPCGEPCPIDCLMDDLTGWSEWSSCSASCGSGTQTRHMSIRRRPQNNGRDCPENLEIRQCDLLPACGFTGPVDDPSIQEPIQEPVRPARRQRKRGPAIILPPLPAPTQGPILAQPLPAQITPKPQTSLRIPKNFCKRKPDGPYAHPGCLCCNELIMCFQRAPMAKFCPPNEVFEAEWRKCVPKEQANNC